MIGSISDRVEQQGFAIIPGVMEASQVRRLAAQVQPLLSDCPAAGIRGLAQRLPPIRELASSGEVMNLVRPLLGTDARLVRSILFNKTPKVNWQVSWHQDLSIAVRGDRAPAGYGPWSRKAGIPHVQPPTAILEQMLTVRLHLDPAHADNGALRAAPGSHRVGRIPAAQAANVAKQHPEFLCRVEAGDALLFRPLLLHASSKATSPSQRRIIHLEYCAAQLPSPLQWNDQA